MERNRPDRRQSDRRHLRRWPLADIFFESDLMGIRIVLSMAELFWGIGLLWHGDTFNRPTYDIMASIAIEEVWGVAFLLTGWMQWSLVNIGDFRCRTARIFAAWNGFLWLFVVGSMYMSVYPPPAGVSGEAALSIAASWLFIRPLMYKGAKE